MIYLKMIKSKNNFVPIYLEILMLDTTLKYV